jgi:hypothetical protein
MDWAKEMRNDGPVMALELAELSRKTGLVVRSLDSAAVDMLFAEFEKYDSHEGIVRLMAEDVIRLFMRHNPRMRSSVSLSTNVIDSPPRSSVIAFGYIFASP